jgi:hypothetical protein
MRLVQERKNLKLRQQPATLCMGLRGVFLLWRVKLIEAEPRRFRR